MAKNYKLDKLNGLTFISAKLHWYTSMYEYAFIKVTTVPQSSFAPSFKHMLCMCMYIYVYV